MNALDAAYHVVHDASGGAPAVAQRLGKAVSTLNQELAPPKGCGAKLGLQTAIAISELTGDHRILHAFAEQLGYRCIKVDGALAAGGADLLAAVTAFMKESGEALAAVHRALEDGRITENEIRVFEKEVADIAPKAVALAERMRIAATEQALARAHRPLVVAA